MAVTTAPETRLRAKTHRLIATRWPTVGVFDTVATPDDAREALVLESWTNDRVTAEIDRLSRIPDHEWVVGQPGSTIVMAAFAYTAPGGGRFNSEAIGAWYAALDLETAIAETVYHHTRRLAHSAAGFHAAVQMRELVSTLDAPFYDIRAWRARRRDLYDPDDYSRSQRFGERLRAKGANGIVYASVRRTPGECVVVYRPRLIPPLREGRRLEYRWTGSPEPAVAEIRERTH